VDREHWHDGRCRRRGERMVGRRERRHRETRDEILAAAREVLLERGAADLSLREIARRADFTAAALYKYFDSKDELVSALADHAMGALLDEFARVPSDLPPDQRALELGMAYLEFARRNPQDVAVITLHEAVHAEPFSRAHNAMVDTIRGVFREGIDGGIFTSTGADDPDFMTYGAWALVQGMATLEERQRPDLAARLRARQRQLLAAYVNGFKTDWSATPPEPDRNDEVEDRPCLP
jgi:AcrR family transcriptional regulator